MHLKHLAQILSRGKYLENVSYSSAHYNIGPHPASHARK